MSVTRREVLWAGAAALPVAGIWTVARGQQATPPTGAGSAQPATPTAGTGAAAGTGAGAGAGGDLGEDPFLAALFLIVGKKQIGVCEWAKGKAQDKDVKAFAQAEIDEHQTLKNRLRDLGFRPPTVVDAQSGNPMPARTPAPPGMAVSVGAATIMPSGSYLIATENEIADQCISTTERELGHRQGARFDKAFVGDQLFAHYGLLDRATVAKKHATARMQPVLTEAMPIIEKHIATLKQLMDRLDGARDEQK
jgi:predicted outer membrane protein